MEAKLGFIELLKNNVNGYATLIAGAFIGNASGEAFFQKLIFEHFTTAEERKQLLEAVLAGAIKLPEFIEPTAKSLGTFTQILSAASGIITPVFGYFESKNNVEISENNVRIVQMQLREHYATLQTNYAIRMAELGAVEKQRKATSQYLVAGFIVCSALAIAYFRNK